MSDCGFCHGQPVQDAGAWSDGTPRPPLPCPRCGEINAPRHLKLVKEPLMKVVPMRPYQNALLRAQARVTAELLDDTPKDAA